jgi:hypothetical protein
MEKNRVLDNGLLRRTFGSKRDKVATGYTTSHNEQLDKFYSSSDSFRMIEIKKDTLDWVRSAHGE